jgi:hypothetical protein
MPICAAPGDRHGAAQIGTTPGERTGHRWREPAGNERRCL